MLILVTCFSFKFENSIYVVRTYFRLQSNFLVLVSCHQNVSDILTRLSMISKVEQQKPDEWYYKMKIERYREGIRILYSSWATKNKVEWELEPRVSAEIIMEGI